MTPTRRAAIGEPGPSSLSYKQALLLQGVLPIVLIAVCLPLGLVVLFLAATAAPLRLAVSHGELFLAGGNASFAGCIVLLAARPDRALNAAIASLFALVLLVVPCYGLWAYISVDTLTKKSYATSVAEVGGAAWAVAGVVVSMAFVRYAYRPTKQ